jgi:photosystem II stability/assembly factor-like uncharacterized protein
MKSPTLIVTLLLSLLVSSPVFSQWIPVRVSDTVNTWGPSLGASVDISIISKDTIYISGHYHRFWRSFDAGKTWVFDSVNAELSTERVQFFDANNGWRYSEYGVAYTTDAGKNWIESGPPIYADTTLPRYSANTAMFFLDAKRGWVGTRYLGIFATIDGGQTWKKQLMAHPSARNAEFKITGIEFSDSANGVAVGWYDEFLRTTDGGNTWLGFIDPDSIPSGPELNAVAYLTPDKCFAITRSANRLYYSTDSARNWSYKVIDTTIGRFLNMYFLDSMRGWLLATKKKSTAGVIYRTTDGGMTWMEDPYTFQETIIKVAFFDSSMGVALAGRGWALLYSPTASVIPKIAPLTIRATWENSTIKLLLDAPAEYIKASLYDILGRGLTEEIVHNAQQLEIYWSESGPLFAKVEVDGITQLLKLLPSP